MNLTLTVVRRGVGMAFRSGDVRRSGLDWELGQFDTLLRHSEPGHARRPASPAFEGRAAPHDRVGATPSDPTNSDRSLKAEAAVMPSQN